MAQLQVELGGSVNYAGTDLAALVGPFSIQQFLNADGGGFSPFLSGEVLLKKAIVPANTAFHSGQNIIVTAPGGPARNCQIKSIDDLFGDWKLTVVDVNQAA